MPISLDNMRTAVSRLSRSEVERLESATPGALAPLAASLGVPIADLERDVDKWRALARQTLVLAPAAAAGSAAVPAASTDALFGGAVVEPAQRIDAIAERVAATGGDLAAFRAAVLAELAGHVPSDAASAYAKGLLRFQGAAPAPAPVAADATVAMTRGVVAELKVELERLRSSNTKIFTDSQASIEELQDDLVAVLTSKASDDRRASAFFALYQNNQRLSGLRQAVDTYKTVQGQFDASLGALESQEQKLIATLPPEAAAVGVIALRQHALGELLSNLEEQATLLQQMIGHAGRTNSALTAVQGELSKSIAATRLELAGLQSRGADALLELALKTGFAALLSLSPAAGAVVGLVGLARDILLRDVDGLRGQVEALAWRTLARLVTAGLVDAGVGELAARVLVGALKAGVTAGAGRAEAEGLLTPAVRDGLNAAQREVVSYLLSTADDALPLAALVRGVISFADMTADQAGRVLTALKTDGSGAKLQGVDAALELLKIAVA